MTVDQSPKILFKCPRCNEEVVMVPTAQNYWHVLNDEHGEKCLEFDVASSLGYFAPIVLDLHRFILSMRPPLIFVRIESENILSAEIKRHEDMLRDAKTEEEKEFLNKVISHYKFRKEKGEEFLNYALEALKHGSFGVKIHMFFHETKKRDVYAFLWKYLNKYFGAVSDIYSSDALLSSSSFKDAENFAKKWFSYLCTPKNEKETEGSNVDSL